MEDRNELAMVSICDQLLKHSLAAFKVMDIHRASDVAAMILERESAINDDHPLGSVVKAGTELGDKNSISCIKQSRS